MDREARLAAWLAEEREHLATGHDLHFHVVVWTEHENEWEVARFTSSPPYRETRLAERDARDTRLLEKVGSFNVDVIPCDRACPRSGLGHFGFDGEDEVAPPWWTLGGWKRG